MNQPPLIDRYRFWLANARSLADNTVTGYVGDVGRFLDWRDSAGADVGEMHPLLLGGYVFHLSKAGKRRSTLKRNIAAVRSFYRFLTSADGRFRKSPMPDAREVVSRQVSVFEVKPFLWDCQDLWSRVLWHPRRPSASYCVELEQYLVHHRYHCNVPRLPTLTKSVIKPTHFAVVADDRPRAHVQRSPHQSPATPDSPMPSLLAAVSGPGRQSHQGGQSFAIPVAQFGKVSHQGCRG